MVRPSEDPTKARIAAMNLRRALITFALAITFLGPQFLNCTASDDLVRTVTFKTAYGTSTVVRTITTPRETLSYWQSASHPPALSDCSDGICRMDFSHYVDARMVANISMDLVQVAQLGEEDLADTVLSFVQNVGYTMNDYTGRNTLYPVETLVLGGVCDDLSVLYASMMITIGFRVVFIWYPQVTDLGGSKVTHVNMGVHLSSRPEHSHEGGWSITHNGLSYYIAETTSDHWRVGDLPEGLQGQNTYVEEAPAPMSTLVITRTTTTSTLMLTATQTLTSTTTRFAYEVLVVEQTTPLLGYLIILIVVGIAAHQLGKRRSRS